MIGKPLLVLGVLALAICALAEGQDAGAGEFETSITATHTRILAEEAEQRSTRDEHPTLPEKQLPGTGRVYKLSRRRSSFYSSSSSSSRSSSGCGRSNLSWGERIECSLIGFIVGLILVCCVVPCLIAWNEINYVKTIKMIKQIAKVLVTVSDLLCSELSCFAGC